MELTHGKCQQTKVTISCWFWISTAHKTTKQQQETCLLFQDNIIWKPSKKSNIHCHS